MQSVSGNRKQVDVAATLRALKDEVRQQRHRLQGKGAIAAETWIDEADLQRVQATARVNPHLPIAWPEWPPGVIPKVVAFLQKVTRRLLRWYINPIVEQQNEFNAAVAAAMASFAIETRAALAHLEQQLHDQAAQQRQQAEQQHREREITAQRLWRLEQQRRTTDDQRSTATEAPISNLQPPIPDTDYFHFELRHRGSPEDIRARQEHYLHYLRDCRRVLDIGCGRGEFVAFLREHGIDAVGVDIDGDMVAHCRAQGLPVEQADALSYLGTLPDDGLDGVFMAQVVEHLPPRELARLLALCRRKLRPGGILVAETINPTCVFALVQFYLRDPSHAWAVHPETLRFMLEDAGFWQVEIEYLSPVPTDQRLAPLAPDGLDEAQVAALNRNIERLNTLLFGYQDYAAVARRPPEDLQDEDVPA